MADSYQQQTAYSFPSADQYRGSNQSQYGQQQPYAQAGYGTEQTSTSYQQPYSPHPQPQQRFVPPPGHQPQQRPPQQPQQAGYGGGYGGVGGGGMQDAFVSDLAAGVLQQQGENYFQRGQAFVQSKMGFLSSSNLQYHFNIDNTYVRDKLVLLALPFLRQWTFSRKPEQISGGHRYQPPRQDVYAPDLYIPFMAVCTYVVLVSLLHTAAGKFTHDNVYGTVSSAFTAWLVHWVVIKATLYMLGIPSSVPFLEILAYAGYPFVPACLGLLLSFAGLWPYRAMLVYGGVTMGTFMVRTMKHVIFHDSPQYSGGSRHNYLLLGLALFQFPFLAYFYVRH